MSTTTTARVTPPEHFTREQLDWLAWLEPPRAEDLTPEQIAGLVEPNRAENPYFRLLALDPAVLEARTRADLDIFHTGARDGSGLPRAERELAATATSRTNGCVFCASVHARFAATLGHRPEEVDALLAQGVHTALLEGSLSARWSAIVRAAEALTRTPIAFGPEHVAELREVGLDDAALVDLISSAGFFSWANRLMLSLGEPSVP